MRERLQKILASAGFGSRRRCESLITCGRVSVNGARADKLGSRADPEKDKILVDGKPVRAGGRVYIALNKPKGYISTCRDTHGRPTVLDLVGDIGVRLYPAGRLDRDTEGLLILTNDGEFANRLLHPRRHVPKTYLVTVNRPVAGEDMGRLRRGVRFGSERFRGASEVKAEGPCRVRLTISEGKKRQVKKMFGALGYKVHALERIKIGTYSLGKLKRGRHVFLEERDVKKLLSV
ncbi:MAG: pseudouridine synthase [Candidatus Tritonobacter lacicola]|nr:pseudouridine synthase [Candidatus Tritonobacter lacicola]